MKGRRFRVDPSILNAFRIESTRSGSLSPLAWTGFHGIPSGPMLRYNDESRIGTTAIHRRNRRDGAGAFRNRRAGRSSSKPEGR